MIVGELESLKMKVHSWTNAHCKMA